MPVWVVANKLPPRAYIIHKHNKSYKNATEGQKPLKITVLN